jgi:hypothetical protein
MSPSDRSMPAIDAMARRRMFRDRLAATFCFPRSSLPELPADFRRAHSRTSLVKHLLAKRLRKRHVPVRNGKPSLRLVSRDTQRERIAGRIPSDGLVLLRIAARVSSCRDCFPLFSSSHRASPRYLERESKQRNVHVRSRSAASFSAATQARRFDLGNAKSAEKWKSIGKMRIYRNTCTLTRMFFNAVFYLIVNNSQEYAHIFLCSS